MATPPSWPTLPGVQYPVKKTPKFSTIVSDHVSGRQVRTALYANPIWQFELSISGLSGSSAYAGLGANSYQALLNLFLTCQGGYGTFLFTDASDNSASGQYLATGDGATYTFQFARQLVSGGFLEPVGWLTGVSSVTVGGVASSSWAYVLPNQLSFNAPPVYGLPIAASFTYAYQCRFSDDTLDFEEFMQNLWETKSIKFESVRGF